MRTRIVRPCDTLRIFRPRRASTFFNLNNLPPPSSPLTNILLFRHLSYLYLTTALHLWCLSIHIPSYDLIRTLLPLHRHSSIPQRYPSIDITSYNLTRCLSQHRAQAPLWSAERERLRTLCTPTHPHQTQRWTSNRVWSVSSRTPFLRLIIARTTERKLVPTVRHPLANRLTD